MGIGGGFGLSQRGGQRKGSGEEYKEYYLKEVKNILQKGERGGKRKV